MHASNSIIKFADDTTVLGLITNKDETAYREEVRALGVWCQENNLTLNVNKGDDPALKQSVEGAPPDPPRRDRIEGGKFKFLSAYITDKMKWSTHTDSVVKKAQQRLFNLRRLKKFGLSPKTLTNLYRCTIESILLGCITAWYDNCSAHNRKALQRVVRYTQRITRGKTTCPPGHLHHPMSQEGQKDHQGQEPPEPLPVHPTIIQSVRSVQVHQSWDRDTEKQLLSQGHQTVNFFGIGGSIFTFG